MNWRRGHPGLGPTRRAFVGVLVLTLLTLAVGETARPVAAATSACPSGLVALTFDDGPGPSTGAVLDTLAAHDVPATFFAVGSRAAASPGMVLRTARAGHEVANHTYSHPYLARLSNDAIRSEVVRADRAIRATGVPPLLLLRPPYMSWDGPGGRVATVAASVGYRVITWTVDPSDYRATTTQIRSRVRAGLRANAVILLHDGSGNAPQMIAALPGIIRDARALGFCFGVLDDHGRVVPRHLGVFIDIYMTTHAASIERLAAEGVVKGCNPPLGTRFCPQDPVTRAQFATILVSSFEARGIDLPVADAPAPTFIDVADTSTHAAAIRALANAGVTTGCNPPDNDRFCPNESLVRGQLATLLVTALSLDAGSPVEPEPEDGSDPSSTDTSLPQPGRFVDVALDNTHAHSIEVIAESGITAGCGTGSGEYFCPYEALTRGQLASFVVRGVLDS